MMNYQQYRPQGFKFLPVVVKNILILNGLFFLGTYALGSVFNIDLVDLLGLHYPASGKFMPFQFTTYMFMHGGFTHILFNMFAVWMFGYVLENFWGPKKFIIYYLVTGIGAALVHYVVLYFQISPLLHEINTFLNTPTNEGLQALLASPHFHMVSYDGQVQFNQFVDSYNQLIHSNPGQALQAGVEYVSLYKIDFLNAPVVIGASGAVFGILLAFGLTFPNSLIYVYFAIPIRAKYFVIIYGAIELYAGIANPGDNVAHFAHLGGMIFGFILMLIWKRNQHKSF